MSANGFEDNQLVITDFSKDCPPVAHDIDASKALIFTFQGMVMQDRTKRIFKKNSKPLVKRQPDIGWRFFKIFRKFFFIFDPHLLCRFDIFGLGRVTKLTHRQHYQMQEIPTLLLHPFLPVQATGLTSQTALPIPH